VAEKEAVACPKFLGVEKFSENLLYLFLKKLSFKKAKFGAEYFNFGIIRRISKIRILSTHNLSCQKFATVCGKIATSYSGYFLTHDPLKVGTNSTLSCQCSLLPSGLIIISN